MEKSPNFESVQELSVLLARTASVTDSPGEKAFPAFLLSILGQIPYFRNNPGNLQAFPIPDDCIRPRQRFRQALRHSHGAL
jgi:arginine utilization protein RocB